MKVANSRVWMPILPLIALTMVAGAFGCGSGAKGEGSPGSPRVISVGETKRLLLELPYQYRWRRVENPKGATGAVAGTAVGRHGTVIHFGVSLGTEGEPVPVPQSGTRTAYDYSKGGGFVFTDDVIVPGGIAKQIQTAAQWREANHMVVQMQEKLCKATTGDVCPI
ncbi:MAG TPA: hypothetical protein VFM51_06070 [Solirubrobacterales bacterium]|nr:hypothetical protein [Solirubrobacterales bacterium]